MAKKRAYSDGGTATEDPGLTGGGNGKLFNAEELPEKVKDAVDNYVKALRAKNVAVGKVNSAFDDCVSAMKEFNIESVRIDEGAKRLELVEQDKLKITKIKADGGDSDD